MNSKAKDLLNQIALLSGLFNTKYKYKKKKKKKKKKNKKK